MARLRVRRSLWVMLVVGCLALTSACQKFQDTGEPGGAAAPAGGIAVVDLNEIARGLGRDQQMQQAVSQLHEELQGQLARMKDDLNAQWQAKSQEYGANPTPEQQAELERLAENMRRHAVAQQAKVQPVLVGETQQLVRRLREEVKPYARDIAKARGLTMVVPKNENWLLTFDPSVDITADVVDAMKKAGLAAPVREAASELATRPAPPAQPPQPIRDRQIRPASHEEPPN